MDASLEFPPATPMAALDAFATVEFRESPWDSRGSESCCSQEPCCALEAGLLLPEDEYESPCPGSTREQSAVVDGLPDHCTLLEDLKSQGSIFQYCICRGQ